MMLLLDCLMLLFLTAYSLNSLAVFCVCCSLLCVWPVSHTAAAGVVGSDISSSQPTLDMAAEILRDKRWLWLGPKENPNRFRETTKEQSDSTTQEKNIYVRNILDQSYIIIIHYNQSNIISSMTKYIKVALSHHFIVLIYHFFMQDVNLTSASSEHCSHRV